MNRIFLFLLLLPVLPRPSHAQCHLDYSNYIPVFTETFDDIDTVTQLSPAWKFWYPADSVHGPYYGWGSEIWAKDHINFLSEGDKHFARLFSTRLPDSVKCSDCPPDVNYNTTKKYASGMLELAAGDDNKPGYTYGIFEASIRLHDDHGSWPAFWMVGPASLGTPLEIDILDGYDAASKHAWGSSVHDWSYGDCGNAFSGHAKRNDIDIFSDFHLYSIAWTPHKITYFIDRKEMFSIGNPVENKEHCPGAPHLIFTKPVRQVLLFTMQMTTWAMAEGSYMDVDYVKVYKPCVMQAGNCKPSGELSPYDYNTTSYIDCDK